MEQDVREVLIKVRDLFSDQSKWTKNVGARDKYGIPVTTTSEDAVCWCLIGAVHKFARRRSTQIDLIIILEKSLETSIDVWNDTHTHEEVLALLDSKIEQVASGTI